jgi:hypothetical protein
MVNEVLSIEYLMKYLAKKMQDIRAKVGKPFKSVVGNKDEYLAESIVAKYPKKNHVCV